jgi:Phosphodiester glycosidase
VTSFIDNVRNRPLLAALASAVVLSVLLVAGLYAYAGSYGLNAVLRRGGTIWLSVAADDARLPASTRLALGAQVPRAEAGPFAWRRLEDGFEVAELPVLAGGSEVDRILLARVDPARFRFEVRTAPGGQNELGDWMAALGAALVINGSYFSRYGTPDTPVVSNGVLLGPRDYDARHGAFVASAATAGIRPLAGSDWRKVLAGADHAMVSYPLLVAPDGSRRAAGDPRWLANRSFVGEDDAGRIVLGTTTAAFFSLARFAEFLRRAPVGLRLALNLDGGPLACQAIAAADYRRDFCGEWELATAADGSLQLLQPLFGRRRWGLPIVLAVFRR